MSDGRRPRGPLRPLEIRAAGDQALLLLAPPDADGLHALVSGLRSALEAGRLRGVVDLLPAAETVLVALDRTADPAQTERALREELSRADLGTAPPEGEVVTIPVRYDGADLGAVARQLGVTTDEVIDRHTRRVWRCRFVGFTAGFGYLEPEDGSADDLSVPRHAQSRTAVPPGAVALADGYSAVYPRRTPGGWQLIGTTTATMWDVERRPPSLLRPGTRVRFRRESP